MNVTQLEIVRKSFESDVGNLEMEVIISDNNSNDGTKEILHKINDQRLKYFIGKKIMEKG